jgi:glycerophosphoryl diester phosphodiesterase/membrane protease YdiL (CAAX protease family)/predicted acylesterase/phospholipase RssA
LGGESTRDAGGRSVADHRRRWRSRQRFHWAHQGGAREGPSNTIWAMRRAIANGADGLELDVHVTRDGQLVVAHDNALQRMTGRSGTIAESSLSEVRLADAAYYWVPGKVDDRELGPCERWALRGQGPHNHDLRIPTLEEVFEAFPGTPFNLELKSRTAGPKLADFLTERRLKGFMDDVIVVSFNDWWLRGFRRRCPDVAVAPGRVMLLLFWLASRFRRPWPRMKPYTALQVPLRLGPVTFTDERLIKTANKVGLVVHVWTVDAAGDMRRALEVGAHGIMTDCPSVLAAVLGHSPTVAPGPVETTDQREELRLALALNGGVSLAVWMGGVVDELLRFVRCAGPYVPALAAAKKRPRIDVMAGASAGGLNGVFLAVALVYKWTSLEQLRDLWVETGSFERLFRRPHDPNPVSIMQGDEYFLVELEKALTTLASRGDPESARDVPIDLRLTVTSLTGEPRAFADNYGGVVAERQHDVELHFHRNSTHDDFACATEDKTPLELKIKRLARAGRSSASFPGAFEASFCAVNPEPDGGKKPRAETKDHRAVAFVAGDQAVGFREDRFLVDGGVLVNLPVEPVVRSIFSQSARGPVERVLAAVVPDPSPAQESCPDLPKEVPGLARTISQSVMGIPRRQSVSRFLDELDLHTQAVRVRRESRTELIIGLTPGLIELSQSLYPAYRRGRIAGSRAQVVSDLCAEAGRSWPAGPRVSRDTAEGIVGDSFPWVPADVSEDAPLPLTGWGLSPISRAGGLLIYLLNCLRTVLPDSGARKLTVHDVLRDTDRLRTDDTRVGCDAVRDAAKSDGKLPDNIAPRLTEKLQAALGAWPYRPTNDRATAAAGLVALDQQMKSLARILKETVDAIPAAAASHADNTGRLAAALREALVGKTEEDALRWLLAIEVIENAFCGFEERTDQAVEIIQIDSTKPLHPCVDPLQRGSAEAKLAGVKLGHFGGFLKRSWRANDWMWGRLDAANALGAILGQPAVGRQAQFEILKAELGNIAVQAKRDFEDGGESSYGITFATRYDEAKARVDDGSITNTELSGLLGSCRIADESLSDEAGSDLATRTLAGAFASAANAFVKANPPVLKNGARVARAFSLVLWALVRTAGRRRRAAGAVAAMVFGLALAGVVADLFYDPKLGPLDEAAWLAFAASTVLALGRAPVVAVPILVIGVLPSVPSLFPEKPWNWWPADDWRWLGREPHRTWQVLFFVVAWVVVVGLRDWRAIRYIRRAFRRQRQRASTEAHALKRRLFPESKPCWRAPLPWLAIGLAVLLVGVKSIRLGIEPAPPAESTRLWNAVLLALCFIAVAFAYRSLRRVVVALGLQSAGHDERWPVSLPWTFAPPMVLAAVFGVAGALRGEFEVEHSQVLETAITIALFEELFFRGAVFALAIRRGTGEALAVSSIAFGLWHAVDSWNDGIGWAWQAKLTYAAGSVIAMTLVGWFVFGFLRLRSRGVYGPWLFHVTWNLGMIGVGLETVATSGSLA